MPSISSPALTGTDGAVRDQPAAGKGWNCGCQQETTIPYSPGDSRISQSVPLSRGDPGWVDAALELPSLVLSRKNVGFIMA